MPLAFAFTTAWALPQTFQIDQIYSNADGTVQFVAVRDRGSTDCDAGENRWAGETLISAGPQPAKTFIFPTNLPTCRTSQKHILIATQGFAALGIVAPDFVIPNGFIQTPDGRLTFAGVSSVAYSALPNDGVTSITAAGTPMQNLAINLGGAQASVLAPSLNLNQHGFTGTWYEPATSGQGIVVEIFPDISAAGGLAVASWFTYDTTSGGADHQRWYTASAPVANGSASAALTIYQNTGGNFNAPPVTVAQPVGTATLSFSTCSTGQLSYTFNDGTGRTGTIPLTRLTSNVTCTPAPPYPTDADFALSGNWYAGATTSGQGLTVEVNPASAAFVGAWYTYVPSGVGLGAAGQRWYVMQGSYAPGSRVIPVTIYETTGGVFDAPTPSGQQTVAVGTGTVTFQSCSAASLRYDFAGTSGGLSGSISLTRVGPTPPGCS